MNKNKIFKELFYLVCWVFFPIGLPILFLSHYFKIRKEKKDLAAFINLKEITQTSKVKECAEADAVTYRSKEEIIDSILFEISSDASCGRIEQASHTIKAFLSQNTKLRSLFIKRFIAMQHHLNSSLFEITIFLFSFLKPTKRREWIEKLINFYPLHFSEDQLDHVLKTEPINNKDPKALLICFLAADYTKVKILLQHGYETGDLVCIPTSYNYSVLDSDGTYFYNVSTFIPKPEHFNIRLDQALGDLEIVSMRRAN